jgi:hypothetical protein
MVPKACYPLSTLTTHPSSPNKSVTSHFSLSQKRKTRTTGGHHTFLFGPLPSLFVWSKTSSYISNKKMLRSVFRISTILEPKFCSSIIFCGLMDDT